MTGLLTNDGWYWGDKRVAYMAEGRMFTIENTTPHARFLIERGVIRRRIWQQHLPGMESTQS